MHYFLNFLLLCMVTLTMSGCASVKTEVIQKAEFTGDTESAIVSINDNQYNFDLTKVAKNNEILYKIDTGKQRIKIFKNNQLIIDRVIFLENHVTTEINIP